VIEALSSTTPTPGCSTLLLKERPPQLSYAEIIERKLITRLDHAACLGRELARAGHSMSTGERCVQDRPPGEALRKDGAGCGCAQSADADFSGRRE
jgi:tetrahydromethanopterin S-methyltransferase subunit A